MLGTPLAANSQPPPAQEAPPSLAEAARRNRARIEESRALHGEGPRFTDADLAGGRLPPPNRSTAPLEAETVSDPTILSEDLPPEELGEDTLDAGPEELRVAMDARLREIGERETEIRARLLDIETSLTAIGASGLPYAQRDPNRYQSPLDTNRLRAEQEELRRELDALAAERRLMRR